MPHRVWWNCSKNTSNRNVSTDGVIANHPVGLNIKYKCRVKICESRISKGIRLLNLPSETIFANRFVKDVREKNLSG